MVYYQSRLFLYLCEDGGSYVLQSFVIVAVQLPTIAPCLFLPLYTSLQAASQYTTTSQV